MNKLCLRRSGMIIYFLAPNPVDQSRTWSADSLWKPIWNISACFQIRSTLSKKLQSCRLFYPIVGHRAGQWRILQECRQYDLRQISALWGGSASCSGICNCRKQNESDLFFGKLWCDVLQSGEFLRHNGPEVWLNGNNGNKSPYKASWCAQFRAVVWRSWLSIIKEPLLVRVRLFQTIVSSPGFLTNI